MNKDSPLESDPTLVEHLEELFLSELETNISINVRGSQFKTHRSILAARSKVFAAMLQHDMVEKRNGEVEINDCDPGCFRNFLQYLYTGKSNLVTADNACALYSIADKYAVEGLKKCCTRCLMQNFRTDLVCNVIMLATMYDETILLEAATNFFCENTKEIIQTPQWTDFQKTNLELSNDLLIKSFGSTSQFNASVFSAFQPSQPANPTFQFDGQPASTSAIAFSSSPKADDTNQISGIPDQNPTPVFGSSAAGTFSFNQNPGVPSQRAAVPTFGAAEESAAGVSTFGGPPSEGFQFGDSDLCVNGFDKDGHHRKMEKLGFGLDDDSAICDQKKRDPQESRLLLIQRHIKSLVHACQCRDVNCKLPSCQKMKRVVQHAKICRQKASRGCPICEKLIAACCYHAIHCPEAKCSVPFCVNIKHQLRQQKAKQRLQQTQILRPRIAIMQNRAGTMPNSIGNSAMGNSAIGGMQRQPTQAWQQLLQAIKSPGSAQQQQAVLAILKSNPHLVAAFIQQRAAQQQQKQQQQPQQQQ